jgi:hypothetical protein
VEIFTEVLVNIFIDDFFVLLIDLHTARLHAFLQGEVVEAFLFVDVGFQVVINTVKY